MLDFSRAFRLETSLRAPGALAMCGRKLLSAMRGLTRADIAAAVGEHLSSDEIKAIVTRRDLLVAHFDQLVVTRGEKVVLY